MNKSELIDRIAQRMGLPRSEAATTLDAVLECIIEGLNEDGRVKISGFGSFVKRHRSERTGIKPTTGEPIRIPASKTCGFKAAPALRDRIDPARVARPAGRQDRSVPDVQTVRPGLTATDASPRSGR